MATITTEDRITSLENKLRQIASIAMQDGQSIPPSAIVPPGAAQRATAAVSEEPEIYVAQAGARLALAVGAAPAAGAPYTIEVRFLGGLTQNQKDAFRAAADRWTRVIVGSLPPVVVEGETIRGVLILAQGAIIDGPGKILGQAGPTRLRPANAGQAAFIPAKGEMMFDSADLADMETRGTLRDVITHEMGHVIGIGTIWSHKSLLNGAGTNNPMFIGPNATREYGVLRGTGPTSVPVENTGGQGTADSHWRDTVFGNELMTGFVGSAGNPLSRMTVASLQDMGYGVNLGAAEPYQLPSHLAIAEGAALAGLNELELGTMLPHIPMVLPPSSLQ